MFSTSIISPDTLMYSEDSWFDVFQNVLSSALGCAEPRTLYSFSLNDRWYPDDEDSSQLPPDGIHGRDNPRKVGLGDSDFLFNAHDHVPTGPKHANMKFSLSRGSCRGGRDDSIR